MHSFSPRRPVFLWSNAVKPMVRSDEVAARISHHRHLQLFHRLDHILPKPIFVGERISRIVDAPIYTSAHMPGDDVSFGCHKTSRSLSRPLDLLCKPTIDI